MSSRIDTAVLLAAGRGTRMGELTSELPKPMLPIAGKPLLEHILDRMREAGIVRALLVIGYRAEVIEAHFERYPMDVECRRQDPPNGTGSAALLGESFTGDRDFLLTYGDILTPASNYAGIGGALTADPEAAMALGVNHVEDPYQGAAVYVADGSVTRIIEKPARGTSTTNWNNAGLYAFRPVIYEELHQLEPSPRGEYELTSAIESLLNQRRRLIPYELQGEWRDVGRPEDLAVVEAMVSPHLR